MAKAPPNAHRCLCCEVEAERIKTATHGLTRVEYMLRYRKAFTYHGLHVVLTFEAQNFWRQLWRQKFCQSAARSDRLVLSPSGVFRVFRVRSVHFVGNMLINHGPFFYCSSGTPCYAFTLLRSKISQDI